MVFKLVSYHSVVCQLFLGVTLAASRSDAKFVVKNFLLFIVIVTQVKYLLFWTKLINTKTHADAQKNFCKGYRGNLFRSPNKTAQFLGATSLLS